MAAGNPTPPQEEQPHGAYASYVPHNLKYSAAFEDSLIDALLHAATQQEGIRLIPDDSDEQPQDGVSIRAHDVSLQSLPSIAEDELPLPLNDSRRIFASPIPGVKLTHPGGYLEGGPGLDPEMDTFPDDFLSNNPTISTPDELRKAIKGEVDSSLDLLTERLRARQKAREKNDRIEKELKILVDQHNMEVKVTKKMIEEAEKKREAREKSKRERSG